MNWFHPIGGPVLLLPRAIVQRWRGQHLQTGYSSAHHAVTQGLSDQPWVGLDIGGLALSDQGPIGIHVQNDRVRFVLRRAASSEAAAEQHAEQAELEPTGRRIPWPGGEGMLFDAVENGDALDSGLTEPLAVALPTGPLSVHTGRVREDGLDLLVIELRPES